METLTIGQINTESKSKFGTGEKVSTELPVIKYNFKGELIFANEAGVELLCTIKGESLEKTVEYLTGKYPHLLKQNCSADFILNYQSTHYFFSAVAFDEAEYVGWYCYHKIQQDTASSSFAA